MPLLYEEITFQNAQPPRMGALRTGLLTAGATLTVIGAAALIHVIKAGKPRKGIRGWPRTLLLAGAAGGGVLLTAGAIHLVRQRAGALQSFKVGKRGWTDWVEEI